MAAAALGHQESLATGRNLVGWFGATAAAGPAPPTVA
jgi:hypothetical protein